MESTAPLAELEVGEYAALAKRPNPKHLVLQYIPSLVALLAHVETVLGVPLTQSQVETIRDHASVMAASVEAARAVQEKRGYQDVRPEVAWEDWRVLRSKLPR